MVRRVRLGISTCTNDTFAFHGLLTGRVKPRGIELSIELADVEATPPAFREISQMVAKLFFTLSDKGAWVAHEGEEPIAILPFSARPVDSTGAGDLFAAGALYGLTHGHTLEECGILGNYCGARIVSQLGARLPERFDGDVRKIFEEYHAGVR